MFYVTIDSDGMPTGFYNEQIHGNNIPADAFEISYDDWMLFNNNSGKYGFINGSIEELPEKKETLEEVLKLKLAQLAQLRYEQETSGITFSNYKIATDRESVFILNSALNSVKNGYTESIEWKSESGEFVSLGLVELDAIANQVFNHIQNCFKNENILKQQILASTDIESINEFDINVGWM